MRVACAWTQSAAQLRMVFVLLLMSHTRYVMSVVMWSEGSEGYVVDMVELCGSAGC